MRAEVFLSWIVVLRIVFASSDKAAAVALQSCAFILLRVVLGIHCEAGVRRSGKPGLQVLVWCIQGVECRDSIVDHVERHGAEVERVEQGEAVFESFAELAVHIAGAGLGSILLIRMDGDLGVDRGREGGEDSVSRAASRSTPGIALRFGEVLPSGTS